MPGVGNIARVSDYEIPEVYQAALRTGIRFFVCRFPKRTGNDKNVFGFYDVIVDETVNYGANTEQYSERWLTGRNSSVLFHVQGATEIAVAFIPDDRWYHNRVVLADNPQYIIEGLYSNKTGLISSQEANMEIQAVRDAFLFEKTIFKAIDTNGLERGWFDTEEQTKEFCEQEIMVPRGANGIPFASKPYAKCKIVKGPMKTKLPEVLSLIKRKRLEAYGWTNTDEFKTVWKPKIEAIIAKRKGEFIDDNNRPAQITPQMLREALLGLDDETRAELMKKPEADTFVAPEPVDEKPAKQAAKKAAKKATEKPEAAVEVAPEKPKPVTFQ